MPSNHTHIHKSFENLHSHVVFTSKVGVILKYPLLERNAVLLCVPVGNLVDLF